MKILKICILIVFSTCLSSCFHTRIIGLTDSSNALDLNWINQNCINKNKSEIRAVLGPASFEKDNVWYYAGIVVVESLLGNKITSQKIARITFSENGRAQYAKVFVTKAPAVGVVRDVTPSRQLKISNLAKIFTSAKKKTKQSTDRPVNFY